LVYDVTRGHDALYKCMNKYVFTYLPVASTSFNPAYFKPLLSFCDRFSIQLTQTQSPSTSSSLSSVFSIPGRWFSNMLRAQTRLGPRLIIRKTHCRAQFTRSSNPSCRPNHLRPLMNSGRAFSRKITSQAAFHGDVFDGSSLTECCNCWPFPSGNR
jgi:hypothetical protein